MRIADPAGGDGRGSVDLAFVTGGYFQTLGIRLLAGRTFTRDEAMAPAADNGGPVAVVIGERLARQAFGEASPIGRRLRVPGSGPAPAHDLVVIGVANDVRRSLMRDAPRTVYAPFTCRGVAPRRPTLLVRSSRPLHEVDERVRQAAFAWVMSLLGGVGFVLAALGSRLIASLLVGVSPLEPGVYAAAASGLLVVVIGACLGPARAATRIAPVETLRAE